MELPNTSSAREEVAGETTQKFQQAFDDSKAFGKERKEVTIDEEKNKKKSISSDEDGSFSQVCFEYLEKS